MTKRKPFGNRPVPRLIKPERLERELREILMIHDPLVRPRYEIVWRQPPGWPSGVEAPLRCRIMVATVTAPSGCVGRVSARANVAPEGIVLAAAFAAMGMIQTPDSFSFPLCASG